RPENAQGERHRSAARGQGQRAHAAHSRRRHDILAGRERSCRHVRSRRQQLCRETRRFQCTGRGDAPGRLLLARHQPQHPRLTLRNARIGHCICTLPEAGRTAVGLYKPHSRGATIWRRRSILCTDGRTRAKWGAESAGACALSVTIPTFMPWSEAHMHGTYAVEFAALSVVVAIIASYTALDLAG